MTISQTVKSQLWARSKNRCAICGRTLVENSGGQYHTVGELCHIVAKENGGPRANQSMGGEAKDSFENIIILCPTHHTLIDKDTQTYSVEHLKKIKKRHESQDEYKIKPVYDTYLSGFDKLCSVSTWSKITNNFLYGAGNKIYKEDYRNMSNFIDFIRSQPNSLWDIDTIDGAFYLFARCIFDFMNIFNDHCVDAKEYYYYEKFYQNFKYPHSDIVFKDYDMQIMMLCNLLAEATRCANLFIKRVSNEIIPDYDKIHGYVCLDNTGLTMSGGNGIITQLHYVGDTALKNTPYEGLEKFLREIQEGLRNDYYFVLQDS